MKTSLKHLAFVFLKLSFFCNMLNFSKVKIYRNPQIYRNISIGLMKVQSQKSPTNTEVIKYLARLLKIPVK